MIVLTKNVDANRPNFDPADVMLLEMQVSRPGASDNDAAWFASLLRPV